MNIYLILAASAVVIILLLCYHIVSFSNYREKAAREIARLNSMLEEQQRAIMERERRVEEHKSIIDRQAQAEQERQSSILQLTRNEAHLSTQLKASNDKIAELQQTIVDMRGSEEEQQKRLQMQFELISNRIVEESRNKVNEFNASRMSDLLKPFESELKGFREQITTAHKEQTRERTELETKIKQMVDISQGMSLEAKNLSNALRGNNKTAGNWGETILENILQNSGLTPGREGYELQGMLRDANGNPYRNDDGRKMIPDAIVHFPDNRNVIIDSKVSISAYTDYCAAEEDGERKMHLKRHIDSIKNHITGLNVKNYENYVEGSLDFVMMFIPNDFAAMVALQEDLKLWQNAYSKKILIISPTNLITSLKIVSDLWSREKQQQNIQKILERARALFDKCATFEEAFSKIGTSLASLDKSYQAAHKHLVGNGNIARQAEMLEALGVKGKKSLTIKSEERQNEIMDLDQIESAAALAARSFSIEEPDTFE